MCLCVCVCVGCSFITPAPFLAEEAASRHVKIRLMTDTEVSALSDAVPRPRGPAEFFLEQRADGSLRTIVIADGAPVVSRHPAPVGVSY